jgi:DNA-binding NarL/FixJ family response regulator
MRPVKSALSSREWEVLDLLTVGRSTAGIADELYLTVETVKSHVKHVMRKLEAHSRAEAVESGKRLRWLVDERPLAA